MLGGPIPLDMGVLPEVSDVFVCDVAVEEKVGQVLMLRSVGSVELVSMKVEPSEELIGDKVCGVGRQKVDGRRTTGVSGNCEVPVLVLSAAEASVLGRKSIGCVERLREGVEEYKYVDVDGERRRQEEL